MNLIKVDRAPTGEQVILTEEETPLLAQNITSKLSNLPKTQRKKPVGPHSTVEIPRSTETVEDSQERENPPSTLGSRPIQLKKIRLLPVAIGLTGALTIGSGLFLYLQGMELWKRTVLQSASKGADEVKINRMAPTRTLPPVSPPHLVVQPKVGNLTLRSGPANSFSQTGTLELQNRYDVIDWQDQWFKVRDNSIAGWVKTDLVQAIETPIQSEEQKTNLQILRQ